MRDELLDRYGEVPAPAENLLRIALIRAAAHNLDMLEVRSRDGQIIFTFKPDARIDATQIPDFVMRHKKQAVFTPYGKPCITYKYEKEKLVEKDQAVVLSLTEMLLEEMKMLKLRSEE